MYHTVDFSQPYASPHGYVYSELALHNQSVLRNASWRVASFKFKGGRRVWLTSGSSEFGCSVEFGIPTCLRS